MAKVKPITWLLIKVLLIVLIVGGAVFYADQAYQRYAREKEFLRQMVVRLQADSRIAEVVVTDVTYNPLIDKHLTTIKFLEYDTKGRPLEPKYFTFSSNIIQFQSLVIRFEDSFVLSGDAMKGKSAYLFWKVFMLDGQETEEFSISPVYDVPLGYKIEGPGSEWEDEIWKEFWEYALDAKKAVTKGIKNAQIEAPGMKFVPGYLYTLKIEHDGGIRIDAEPISAVLRGEKL